MMRWLIFIVLVSMCFSCSDSKKKQRSIEILKYAKTDYIPSASGLEMSGEHLMLIGDDAPYLYALNKQTWNIEKETQIAKIDSMVGNRMYYKTKPDFEALGFINTSKGMRTLVVGSGSWSPRRDTCVLLDLKNNKIIGRYSLRPIFDAFKHFLKLKSGQDVNIEGFATDHDQVYFAHRGSVNPPNAIFSLNKEDFMNWLSSNQGSMPMIKMYTFQLPEVENERAGISGLDVWTGKGLLLSASIEVTNDSKRDGEILGSFISYIPYGELTKKQAIFTPVMKAGKPLITKIESVVVEGKTSKGLRFYAVSDNDDGSSEIFQMELKGL